MWHDGEPTSKRPPFIDNIMVEQIEFPDLNPLRKAETRGGKLPQCYSVGSPYLIAGQHMNPILEAMWFLSKLFSMFWGLLLFDW